MEKENRIYEASFLLVPFLSEEDLANQVTAIKSNLESLGAISISEDYPKLINLAYTMDRVISNKRQKFNSAFFGWVKFEANPDALKQIKEWFERNENVIRFLTVKTVRENTMSSIKFARKTRKPGATKTEAPVEINKEEIDKQIEALVTA
jgi:ribosomal protein S6